MGLRSSILKREIGNDEHEIVHHGRIIMMRPTMMHLILVALQLLYREQMLTELLVFMQSSWKSTGVEVLPLHKRHEPLSELF